VKKRKKIPQIIGHARAPATEGSHPLRHNFAEELGSNGPENTAWQQLKQSQSGVMKDNVHQGCQESKTARLHLLLPVIPQEEQRIPRLKGTPPSAVGSCPSEEQPKDSEGQVHDIYRLVTTRRMRPVVRNTQKQKCRTLKPTKDNNIRQDDSILNLKYY
jgi:hypothetical protein